MQVTGIIWAAPGTQFGSLDADTETVVGTINNQMDANVIGLVRLAKALEKDLIATKVHCLANSLRCCSSLICKEPRWISTVHPQADPRI